MLECTVAYNGLLSKDLYTTLDIPQTADADTLTRAYRQAAKRTHPDAGGTAEAFQAVQDAYAYLPDPFRRQLYDRDRAEAARSVKQAAAARSTKRAAPANYPWNTTSRGAPAKETAFYEDEKPERTRSPGEYMRKLGH